MPAKKPSAKPAKAAKTVSAKAAPAPGKAKAAPAKTSTGKAVSTKTPIQTRPPDALGAGTKPTAKAVTSRVSPPAEDTDLELSPNLLSGPRNVQPYVVRKGEEYMNKEQLEHFRTILSSWKQDLMQEVDRTVLHMKDEAANFPDPNDRATQESEFSLELRTRDRERKLIRKIDEAIKRIEDGSYGFCLETGEPIGVKRLEARPVATLSVEAQERRERREKQFGDRDDWYR
jgi:DnaK suppressor protein